MEEHAPNDTGAGAGNRTPIPSLENLYTNRCTTPAGNIASIPYLCTAHKPAPARQQSYTLPPYRTLISLYPLSL